MAKKNLYINDISLGTYGIYISSDTVLNAPSFDYVEHEVPGRDGTLLQYNNRLTNVVRKFSCYVPENTDVQTAVANVKRLVYTNPGYVKLSSDYEANIYQYGYFVQGFEVKPFNNYRTVSFDLYFSCMPMRYTTGSATSSESCAYFDSTNGFQGIFNRNRDIVRRVFDDVEPSYIPNDDYFYIFNIGGGHVTDYTVTWSGGDMPFVLFECSNNLSVVTYQATHGYTNTSLDIADVDATHGLYVLCPAFLSGTISASWTDEDSVSQTYVTNDISGNVATLSGLSTATFGCDFSSFEIEYRPMNSYSIKTDEAVVLCESYLNNKLVGKMAISLMTNTLSGANISKYRTYLEQGTYNKLYSMTADIDPAKKSAVFKMAGQPDLPADAFFEFTGDLGQYDKLKIFAPARLEHTWFKTHMNPGYAEVYQFATDGKWWLL